MISYSTPWLRGLAATAIGITLVLSHILFAAAMPLGTSEPANTYVEQARDVEETSSTSVQPLHAENCYSEQQFVKSVRGKAMVLRYMECD
jgi:hypothetical protein